MPTATVDPAYASWLKSDAMFSTNAPSLPSALLPMSVESEIYSPFATKAAADTELTRQVALLDNCLALDNVSIPGRRVDLAGKCITLTGDQLGYGAGVNVLVLSAVENDDATTQLSVLRAL
jgi:hypothetical protein